MSEFTVGILFRKEHTEQVQTLMQATSMSHIIQSLNTSWEVLYLEDDWLYVPSTLALIKTLSNSVPLLRFTHPEDNGWGYEIYHHDEEIASLFDSYTVAYAMAGLDFPAGPDSDDVYKEMRQSKEYPDAVRAQFAQCNVSNFRLFDVDQEVINQLEELFLPDIIDIEFEGVDSRLSRFCSYLDIQEMEWVSYHYIHDLQGNL